MATTMHLGRHRVSKATGTEGATPLPRTPAGPESLSARAHLGILTISICSGLTGQESWTPSDLTQGPAGQIATGSCLQPGHLPHPTSPGTPRPCPAPGVCPKSSALTVLQQLLWDSSRLDRGLLPESVGQPRPPARPEPRNKKPRREGCVYFTLHTFFQHKEAPAPAALWALAGTFQQPRVPHQPSYLLRGEAGPLPPSGVSLAWHLIFRTVF